MLGGATMDPREHSRASWRSLAVLGVQTSYDPSASYHGEPCLRRRKSFGRQVVWFSKAVRMAARDGKDAIPTVPT